MTDDEIRKLVQARFAAGTLPRHITVMAQPLIPGASPGHRPPDAIVVGSALSEPCAVCGAGATQMRYNAAAGPVAFHERCHTIWEQEAAKPIRRG
jgi:hypothetical protein